ncbi:MAG: NAD-dependent deacylase [Pyrinomonadaceae bacterium]
MNRLNKGLKIAVLTGAGISAESGIPTFRGGGESVVWKGMPFDQISSAQMVRDDLDAVWEWFDHRRGLYRKCEPNPAHLTLAAWQDEFEDFTLVTQNVDGLHERAGSRNIIELHGNINHARCTKCGRVYKIAVDDVPHKPTHCKDCGEKVRPDVVLFGEMLPEGAFEKAAEKAATCEVFFIIGTSALVYPAAILPETAKQNGAFLIEVNPEETPLTEYCDESLRGKAGEILPALFQQK